MITLPTIDLNAVLPIAGLALIAAVCVLGLLLHTLLRSRIALLIAVVFGVVIAGPTLAGALRDIVWALAPMLIVVAIAIIIVIWLVQRNPDLMALVRDVLPRKEQQALPQPDQGHSLLMLDQPRQSTPAPARRVQIVTPQDADRWGW